MDFSWLARGGTPLELPDPIQQYTKMMSLKDLARRDREGAFKEQQLVESDQAMKDSLEIFGRAQTVGFEKAIAEAVAQGKRQGAQMALKAWREQQNIELEGKTKEAVARKNNADADKDINATRMTKLEPVVNNANFLTRNPNVSLEQLQGLVRDAIAADPQSVPQDVDFGDLNAARRWAAQFGTRNYRAHEQTQDAQTAIRDQNTNANNQELRKIQQGQLTVAQLREQRQAAHEKFMREQTGEQTKAADWVVNEEKGHRINKRTGVRVPLTDANGNPVAPLKDEKDIRQIQGQINMADRVLQEVKEIRGQVGWDTTGVIGAGLGMIPGTPAFNVREKALMVKANLSFAELERMRQASQTGGALGNVSDYENKALSSTIASLNPNMSDEEFLNSLDKVEYHLDNVKMLMEGRDPRKRPDYRGMGKAGATGSFDGDGQANGPAGSRGATAKPTTENNRPAANRGDPPMYNSKGWGLMIDKYGNKAYVGPNKEVEEVK